MNTTKPQHTPTSDLDLKGIYLPTGRNPVGARIHAVEL